MFVELVGFITMVGYVAIDLSFPVMELGIFTLGANYISGRFLDFLDPGEEDLDLERDN